MRQITQKTFLLLASTLLCGPVFAQASAEVTQQQTPSKAIMIVTPHAPVARQVEPLVPPVKRAKPNGSVATAPAKKAVPVAEAAKSGVPIASSSGNALAPSAPDAAIAKPATATSVTQNAANIAVPYPAPTERKFVAHACKLGDEYSVGRKTCFTPGVKRASTSKVVHEKTQTARNKTSIDQIGRSALGAKPKR